MCPEAIDDEVPVISYTKLLLLLLSLFVGLVEELKLIEISTKTPQFKPFIPFDV